MLTCFGLKNGIIFAKRLQPLNYTVKYNSSWTQLTQEKSLHTPRHALNVFSEPRPSRTLELVKASTS